MSQLQQTAVTAVTAERPAGERRVTATADSSTQPSQRRDLQVSPQQTAVCCCHSYCRQQHTAVTAERPAGERRVTATADSSTQPSQRRDLQERDVSQLQQTAAHSRHSERPAGERRLTAADSSTQPCAGESVSQLQQTAAHSRHSGETCRTSHSYSRQQHTAVTADLSGERRVTATADSSLTPAAVRCDGCVLLSAVAETRLSPAGLCCDGCVLLSAVAVTRLSPAGLSAVTAVCCCLL